jgi:hypothetical protein
MQKIPASDSINRPILQTSLKPPLLIYTDSKVLSMNLHLFLTEYNATQMANFILENEIKELHLNVYSNSPGLNSLIEKIFGKTHYNIALISEQTERSFRHLYSPLA